MKHDDVYSHNQGAEEVQSKCAFADITSLLNAPLLSVAPGTTAKINRHITESLVSTGWAMGPRVHPSYNLKVNAINNGIALTVQTGNITRAFYDLMKFQVLHTERRIDVAVLVLPSHTAASLLGSNVANFNRVTNEMPLFKSIITVPCLVLSFV